MKVKFENGRFIAISTYEEKDIPKNAGFRWDSIGKYWYTTDSATAKKLAEFSDDTAKEQFNAASKPPEKVKIIFRNNQFVAICSYEQREIPKAAGFRWESVGKYWYTTDTSKAAKLIDFADEEVKKRLAIRTEAIEASKATDTTLDIPAPAGLQYRPFQKAGIVYAMNRPNALIADEMGLGKTIQAIGIINASRIKGKVLVVCPASLKINWKREMDKWLVDKRSVEIANGKEFPDADIVIVNYDILKKYHDELRQHEFDLLVCDESHYLKNSKTQRTSEVLGKWDKDESKITSPINAKRKVFLTGTPILNRPNELWPLVSALGLFKSWKYYHTRYCDGKETRYGWDVSGASNLGELQEKLRESIMVRRLKKDVLKELPAKQRQILEIPNTRETTRLINQGRILAEKNNQKIINLQIAVELSKASDNPEDYKEAVKRLGEASKFAFDEMAQVRHDTAVAKIPSIVEHVHNCLEEDEDQKIILFAHHHDVINGLKESLGEKAVVLTGETKEADRQAAVDKFQTDPNCKVFIGSIGAAGVGITLTASNHVIFAEEAWTPAAISQAEDRAHRIGQENSVLVQHLILEDSMDVPMVQQLLEKQEIIDKALDDPVAKFIVPTIIEKPSTHSHSREMIRTELKTSPISKEEIAIIHQKLKILSAACDGAYSRDNVGFNKIDTGVGKMLAAQDNLTEAQAWLGKRIVAKYHRQLASIDDTLPVSNDIQKRETPREKRKYAKKLVTPNEPKLISIR
jgi:SWI/SNF-related matrix-associated actin-dependent regulator 1 of chromatin subfamily A